MDGENETVPNLVVRLRAHKPYNQFTDGPLVLEAASLIETLARRASKAERLADALRPFADHDDFPTLHGEVVVDITVYVDEARAARAAIKEWETNNDSERN